MPALFAPIRSMARNAVEQNVSDTSLAVLVVIEDECTSLAVLVVIEAKRPN